MVFYVLFLLSFFLRFVSAYAQCSYTHTRFQATNSFLFAVGVLTRVLISASLSFPRFSFALHLPFTIFISIDFPAFCGIISPSIRLGCQQKLHYALSSLSLAHTLTHSPHACDVVFHVAEGERDGNKNKIGKRDKGKNRIIKLTVAPTSVLLLLLPLVHHSCVFFPFLFCFSMQ